MATGTLGQQGAGWAVLPDGAGGQVHTHRALVIHWPPASDSRPPSVTSAEVPWGNHGHSCPEGVIPKATLHDVSFLPSARLPVSLWLVVFSWGRLYWGAAPGR